MEQAQATRRQILHSASLGAAGAAGLGRLAGPAAHAAEAPGEPNKKPPLLRIGFPTYMLKHFNLDQAVAMTKRVAVKYVCLRSFHLPLDSTPAQAAAAIEKVKQAGLVPYAAGVIYMRTDKQVARAFEYAKAGGFKLITACPQPALLALVEKKAKAFGVKVAIHNHGPEDKAYPTPLAVYEQIRKLDRRIGICHDTGHTLRAGTDPSAATAKCANRLMDIHLKDVDAAVGKGHSTELGRGVMDIPEFLRTLRKIGYTGIVGIEYEKHMKDPLPGLAESVGYTRGVLAVLEGNGR